MGTICNLCMLHQTCFSSYSLPFCGVVSNVDGVWESGGVVRSDRDWINVCCRWTGESWSVKRELFWAMGKRESFPHILSYALSKVFIVRISTCRLSWYTLLYIYIYFKFYCSISLKKYELFTLFCKSSKFRITPDICLSLFSHFFINNKGHDALPIQNKNLRSRISLHSDWFFSINIIKQFHCISTKLCTIFMSQQYVIIMTNIWVGGVRLVNFRKMGISVSH